MHRARILALVLLGLLAACGTPPAAVPRLPAALTEAEARARFEAQHPGAAPLNQAIAAAALDLHRRRPMGKFVLGLDKPGNDCKDFVACCIDQGLGVKARVDRGSSEHLLGTRRDLFEWSWWSPGTAVQPGDVLTVRHSPWYEPNDAACWHCGIVGGDGLVYDFSKLIRWSEPRYGRHTFEEFVKHSHGPQQVLLQRLHWRYRYGIDPLPIDG
jgi:hypothetical protein